MSYTLRCLNSPASLRVAAQDDADPFIITFEDADGTIADVEVRMRAVLPMPDRGERLVVVFPSGHHVSLLLVDDDGAPEVDQPDVVINLINDGGRPCDLVLQCEQYLRWHESTIIWGSPGPSDDGPYAEHPVLAEVSRDTREHIASHITAGKHIAAIKSLRAEFPTLGLLEAKIFIEVLAKFY